MVVHELTHFQQPSRPQSPSLLEAAILEGTADFVASLAVAGADGTIGHRMTGGIAERYVRAKTGTLNGISALSGFASAPLSGAAMMRAPLAFSIVVNDLSVGVPAKPLQDAIVESLVAYLGSPLTPPPAAASGTPAAIARWHSSSAALKPANSVSVSATSKFHFENWRSFSRNTSP